jgi:HPt (histidine-containing phosphotransfer) domain-containing protein
MPMEENIEDSPLYDLSRLQAISRGDNDFINKMCSIFIKEIPPTIASISMANQQGDLVQVKSLAHRIKATFDNMGMVLLSENIRQIENLAANETSISDLGLLINKMEKTVQMVIKQLEQETKEAEIIL